MRRTRKLSVSVDAQTLDELKKLVPGGRYGTPSQGTRASGLRARVHLEKNGRWYAVFECEREVKPLPKTGKLVGVDRGVYVLAALSDGTLVANRKVAERQRRLVTGHQRALDASTVRDGQGHCVARADAKRQAAARRLARAKEREANARLDNGHKVALKLIPDNDAIGMELLNVRAMTRSAKGTVEKPGRTVAAKSGSIESCSMPALKYFDVYWVRKPITLFSGS